MAKECLYSFGKDHVIPLLLFSCLKAPPQFCTISIEHNIESEAANCVAAGAGHDTSKVSEAGLVQM